MVGLHTAGSERVAGMPFLDSIDKIVTVYFANLTKAQFTYKGVVYTPRAIRVSPLIFRDFNCPQKCGGCCPKFTLDYLPTETTPYELPFRLVEVDGRRLRIRTDHQEHNGDHHCVNLDRDSGRCKIHGVHPFACDFELLRFVDRGETVHFSQQLFGRGWAMLRVDGGRGSLCSMAAPTDRTVPEILRKLERLQRWSDHFGIETWTPEIMRWIGSGPHTEPLELVPKSI